MELIVLFAIFALFLFGPRKSGRMPGPLAITIGLAFLLYMALAFVMGWGWNAIFGTIGQP
jgi:hypothetical protein